MSLREREIKDSTDVVACGGELHVVTLRRGRLRFSHHSIQELEREIFLAELAGERPEGCAGVLWQLRHLDLLRSTTIDMLQFARARHDFRRLERSRATALVSSVREARRCRVMAALLRRLLTRISLDPRIIDTSPSCHSIYLRVGRYLHSVYPARFREAFLRTGRIVRVGDRGPAVVLELPFGTRLRRFFDGDLFLGREFAICCRDLEVGDALRVLPRGGA